MSRPQAPLSSLLADVARAVVAAQKDLDREADAAPRDGSLAPLAFVVKETQLALAGQLVMRAGGASVQDRALVLSQIDRVQAGLYGSRGIALTCRVCASIRAAEPKHGG